MGENSFEATLRLTAFPVNSIRLVQAGVPPFVFSVAMLVSSPEKGNGFAGAGLGASYEAVVWGIRFLAFAIH